MGASAVTLVEVTSLALAGEAARPSGDATAKVRIGHAEALGLASTDVRALPDEAPDGA